MGTQGTAPASASPALDFFITPPSSRTNLELNVEQRIKIAHHLEIYFRLVYNCIV